MIQKIYKRYPNLPKILHNSGWLFFDKIFRMGMGMFLGVWIAKYLGPDNYGKLNYVVAFVALVGSFTNLGLDGIAVRELIRDKTVKDEIISTSFVLQSGAGLLAYIIAILLVTVLRPAESDIFWMTLIVGFTLSFRAIGVVKYWYESQVLSKYLVWLDNGLFLLFSVIRIFLILKGFTVIAFVWAGFVESTISLFGYYLMYKYHKGALSIRHANWQRARSLIHDSWMLLLSGLAIIVYMRIDQVMIGQILGDEAVGVYTAAVKISEVWYFIPTVIASSVLPSLLKAKEFNQKVYLERIALLHSLMFIISLLIAIPMTFLSGPIIDFLFGDDFSEAGLILAIHIWAGIFVFLGIASSRYFLTENLQRVDLYKSIVGCSSNIVLNFILIPMYGVKGAAIATVISQFAASVLFNVFLKRTREIFFIQMKSILFWNLFRKWKHLRKSLG
ncbi:flippase [Leptospira yasudae]|uniref:flippase n=1 Tax=Leptospira yasudae TaxID=2202201 RepID=UPI000E59C34C|nr:flippase [Leptospira yasudae]RHX91303.1 flippase [Leptospira yasudae]